MAFSTVALHNFRSYSRYALTLSPGVTIVAGPNGSGKTNLLEALYVLSVGGSFRGVERDLITHGSDWFRLEGVWEGQQRILTYQLRAGQPPEKQFSIDGSKKARLTHPQRTPVVLFEPDHLQLLSGQPTPRRDYLDTLLSGLYADYAWTRHQFDRVLLQRNNVLKRYGYASQLDDHLFVWDVQFAELARSIVERRLELAQIFDARLSDVYSLIAHTKSRVAMHYVSSIPTTDYQARALKLLHARRADDVARGFTTIGPQRDDFYLELNGEPAASSASRGEMRTLLLALKIIELELTDKHSDHTPLLLLDDVFSELDASRRKALAKAAKAYQTVITTTDKDSINQAFRSDYSLITTTNRPA